MTPPTPTIAVPLPATSSNSEGMTSPSTQQPRAADKAGVQSMLAAAIGLTRLGAPSSPSKASPNPSTGGVKDIITQASVGAVDVAGNAARATRDIDESLFMSNKIIKPSPALRKIIRPALKEMIATATLHPRPEAMAMMSPPLARMPAHYHRNTLPPHPALIAAAARLSPLMRPTPWSPQTRPSPAGVDTLHMPFNPHSAQPLSNAAIAMDRFSVGERIAFMNRAAAAAAFATRPSPHDPYYPPYASLPPLPTPHQTTPAPNNKNFPETLFDVISSEEHAHIISWLPHGEGFVIHDKQRFSSMILPRYFDGAKFTSFTRRLKRWSFVRTSSGPELGAYYNTNFVRGHLELVQKLRYRMDGQFEEGKKKSDDKNEEHENLGEQIEMEVESKVQVTLSNKEAQLKDSSPRLIGQANREPHQNQVLPANIPNPEIKTMHLTNHQERPMPLPKRPKVVKKTATAFETLRSHPTSFPRGHSTLIWPNNPHEQRLIEMQQELLMARSRMPNEVIPSGATATRSIMGSSFSNHPYYTTASTAERILNVQRAERAQRILEAEHMLGQNHRNRSNTNSNCKVVPNGATVPISIISSSLSNHPHYTTASTAERIFNVERAERILEAKHMLGQNHRSNTNSNNPNQERIAHNILGAPTTHEDISDTAMRDMQSRMAPSFIHLSERPRPRSNSHENHEGSVHSQRERQNMSFPIGYNRLSEISQGEFSREGLCEAQGTLGDARSDGGGRAIIMSREEEEEFARYLISKRSPY